MNYSLPLTIENAVGEKIIFQKIIHEPDGDKLIVSGSCQPECGPPMHIHFKQDECITVKKGKIGYQVQGEEKKFADEGASILFKRGTPHKFWNAGTEVLEVESWVKPADNIIFFLSSIYAALNKPGAKRPEPFDSAYLLTRYKKEYAMTELPSFVRKVIIPVTYFIGRITNRYKKFKEAPSPVGGV
ncbi:MAG: cupin domain-containing protein [Ginsengibacter sp.]